MSNFSLWWGPDGRWNSPEADRRVAAALEPFAVDGLRTRAFAGATMVHARFDTVPEASQEDQPIVDESNGLAIVASARLDNLDQLQRRLPRHWPTHTDAHALLAAYRLWQDDLVHHVRGEFAFAIWDQRRSRLVAARDHLGIRPLFVACAEGGIVVGTVPAAVIAHPSVPRDIDREFVAQYLGNRIWETERSPWSAVRRVDAGQRLRWDGGSNGDRGTVETSTYWRPLRARSQRRATIEDVEQMIALTDDALVARLRRVGPLACDVSGGLDSAIVAGLAVRHAEEPEAVTIALSRSDHDETMYAVAVAERLGLRQHIFEVRDPLPDSSAVVRYSALTGMPSLAIPSAADAAMTDALAAGGLRVRLTGNGGDALFDVTEAQLIPAIAHPRRFDLPSLAGRFYGPERWRSTLTMRIAQRLTPAPVRDRRRAVQVGRHGPTVAEGYAVSRRSTPAVAAWSLADELWRETLLNGFNQLSMDQTSMLGALWQCESRHPFLDHRLVEAASGLVFVPSSPRAPYRELQRAAAASMLPDVLLKRVANTDHRHHNEVRLRCFEADRCELAALRRLDIVDVTHVSQVARRCLARPAAASSRELWLALAALTTEVWLSVWDTR